MLTREEQEEIKNLDFENFLWVVVIFLAIANILGDTFNQEYIKTKNWNFQASSKKIFIFTVSVTILIYIYYMDRNIINLQKVNGKNKGAYLVRLIGTILILIGAFCLLYFQTSVPTSTGAPDAV